MAYGKLSKPGSKYGACMEDCDHIDCKATREQANSKCTICGEKIGYETPFQRNKDGSLVHYLCNIEKIEKERNDRE